MTGSSAPPRRGHDDDLDLWQIVTIILPIVTADLGMRGSLKTRNRGSAQKVQECKIARLSY